LAIFEAPSESLGETEPVYAGNAAARNRRVRFRATPELVEVHGNET
jgi:hypothetical protein